MKPLIVLLVLFTITLFTLKFIQGTYNFAFSARMGMSAMLLFTALGHFMFTDGMSMMVPEFIPFKKEMVYFTAIIEILGAFALHIPQVRVVTAWLLILFFILILPANIKASIASLDYQKSTYEGNGPFYLWFRIPLQILFIFWIYKSAIKTT
ncbi:hypothetical protein [uncultured Maribacter sp.]|uniref:DoxX family protein n=1 Tax=uncultured Maribacter sp. TaxID=431308 RepID=UPI0030EF7B3B|tara:strand:- start:26657 stop:27112 length:456 start_codon:yes stop_codon:yes gene_type:complete